MAPTPEYSPTPASPRVTSRRPRGARVRPGAGRHRPHHQPARRAQRRHRPGQSPANARHPAIRHRTPRAHSAVQPPHGWPPPRSPAQPPSPVGLHGTPGPTCRERTHGALRSDLEHLRRTQQPGHPTAHRPNHQARSASTTPQAQPNPSTPPSNAEHLRRARQLSHPTHGPHRAHRLNPRARWASTAPLATAYARRSASGSMPASRLWLMWSREASTGSADERSSLAA